MTESPLANPVTFHSDHLKVLDETVLPWEERYIEVNDSEDAVSILKDMKTRAFGQVLLYYYLALLEIQKISNAHILERIKEVTDSFSRARPTFAFPSFYRQIESWLREEPDPSERKEHLIERIFSYLREARNLRLNRAKLAAAELPQGAVLTHCNVSGEMVYIGEVARREFNKKLDFWVTETRPYLQGARLTAWELNRAGFRVIVLPDALSTKVIKEGKVKAAIVGADRCTKNGDVINKIGTYQIALACHHFDVPFYALIQPPTADTIEDIEIEYRNPEELLFFQGVSTAQAGAKALYPAFDITPADMVTRLICFDRVYTPEELRRTFSAK